MYSFHFLDRAVSSFMGATDWRASSPASPRSCVIATARIVSSPDPRMRDQPACPWLNASGSGGIGIARSISSTNSIR